MSAWLLQPHPATPCPAVRRLHAWQARTADGWRLRYTLDGAPSALRLPPPARHPGPADGLWRHTCVEAFVGTQASSAYLEFNFSPSGDWAAYAFSSERQRDLAAPALPAPRITCTQDAQHLALDAVLPTHGLPDTDWIVGLSAVIKTTDGQLSYWALAHPRAQPDFHHRAGWTVHLPAPDTHTP